MNHRRAVERYGSPLGKLNQDTRVALRGIDEARDILRGIVQAVAVEEGCLFCQYTNGQHRDNCPAERAHKFLKITEGNNKII